MKGIIQHGCLKIGDQQFPLDRRIDLRNLNLPHLSLPKGLTVESDLILEGMSSLTSLPDDMFVGGTLDLRGTRIDRLPRGLIVDGSLDLRGTDITALPDDLIVKGKVLRCGVRENVHSLNGFPAPSVLVDTPDPAWF